MVKHRRAYRNNHRALYRFRPAKQVLPSKTLSHADVHGEGKVVQVPVRSACSIPKSLLADPILRFILPLHLSTIAHFSTRFSPNKDRKA